MTSEQRVNEKINNALNGFTPYFRLLTPFLLAVCGMIGVMVKMQVDDIKTTMTSLDRRVMENMKAGQDARLDAERRITWLEAQHGKTTR